MTATKLTRAELEWYAGDLERQVKELTKKLAATWQPVEPGTYIDCPLPEQPYDEITCDIIAVLPGAVSLEQGAYMLAHARLDDEHAFCRRAAPDPLAQPDPIAHLIPPLDQWPDDAVAWCIDGDGLRLWVRVQPGSSNRWTVYGQFVGSYNHWSEHDAPVTLPPGFDWRDSLRLRPRPGAEVGP